MTLPCKSNVKNEFIGIKKKERERERKAHFCVVNLWFFLFLFVFVCYFKKVILIIFHSSWFIFIKRKEKRNLRKDLFCVVFCFVFWRTEEGKRQQKNLYETWECKWMLLRVRKYLICTCNVGKMPREDNWRVKAKWNLSWAVLVRDWGAFFSLLLLWVNM
jgi:hypothetical protein